jgi:arylsulfatase
VPLETPGNVVLIAVDALRADHLGCYGHGRKTSPTIDTLAREGALVDGFFCAGIPSHPSYTTLFTGQHPITHGIVADDSKTSLSREAPYLSQALLENGFTTVAVDNLGQQRQWFRRGYEFYINPGMRHPSAHDVSCQEINQRAIRWVRDHVDEQFFLFIHYVDPRGALTPPDVAHYDQEIRHLDAGVGELLQTLQDVGLDDETLVVLLGAYGESLPERRGFVDNRGLYDSLIHVPLIARWPGQIPAGRRIPNLLQHQDVAPTILEAAGLDAPFEMDGESFWRLLNGQTSEGGRERVFSCECTRKAKWSMRTNRFKYILDRQPGANAGPDRELFDLSVDPAEEHNIAADRPDLAANLERDLESWIAERLDEQGKDEDPLREQDLSPALDA